MKPVRYVELENTLAKELKRGGITETHIRHSRLHHDGLCDGQKILIDPAPQVVETLVHELLHRRFPRWGERRVNTTAKRMVYNMNAREIRLWYRRYNRTKKTRHTPINAED
jgi:hypothetical protein